MPDPRYEDRNDLDVFDDFDNFEYMDDDFDDSEYEDWWEDDEAVWEWPWK